MKINVCSWNIRRGLAIREQELTNIIKINQINMIFLVETDTSAINNENDYSIQGFKTIIQKKRAESDPTRIICLIDNKLASHALIRNDLTSTDFPSLWVEIENEKGKNIICGGYYREWAPGGDKSVESQVQAITVFTSQIEDAVAEQKSVVILGDANLCAESWDSPGFLHKRVADELKETLFTCGLTCEKLGLTYTADRLSPDGSEISSAIDHIYISQDIKPKVTTSKLESSATDHLPIMASFSLQRTKKITQQKPRTITKRSMKDFTKTRWVDSLRNRDWLKIDATTDLHNKAIVFANEINSALDECAPYKSFKVRDNYRPGLSEAAKDIIKERDTTRRNITSAKAIDKPVLKAKYKQLRNKALSQIRKDSQTMNADRIAKAKNEGETWRVVNDIIKPRSSNPITLKTADGELTEEAEVADRFNKFFVKKISDLKQAIDPCSIKDPTEKLEEKMKHKNLKFSIKPVTVTAVEKIMKQMAKKKSKGNDGISQECLILGHDVIAAPLTKIINESISSGVFPESWKEAVVVPILKKGDPKDPKNYRPVSCLAAASKVLEKVVCEQLTRFVEIHHLLPDSQHGFRANRSTMTALTTMQKEWISSTEGGLITGILVWDLSSAFDTLDINLFLRKLTIYGADETTRNWFRSFLSGRTQRVRIGGTLSDPLELVSGVPQGGILSPIIFTLYTADMEQWLKSSKLSNFADDTTTGVKNKHMEGVRKGLEEDAHNVLCFMASNGLVANQSKTEFLVLNYKMGPGLQEIRVGETMVQRTSRIKLLGINIEDNQDWQLHIKKVISSLNQRLFVIRRIANQLPQEKMIAIIHSLWMSKLRYGLQLCTTVQIALTETRTAAMKSLQKAQNRMLRLINKTKIKDKISTHSMLDRFNLLSVNQLAAQIKLIEVWKSINIENYPIQMEPYNIHFGESGHSLRERNNQVFRETSRMGVAKSSFNIDAARLWNVTPGEIRASTTKTEAKRLILDFVKTLPV